jgi:hypothetical protein
MTNSLLIFAAVLCGALILIGVWHHLRTLSAFSRISPDADTTVAIKKDINLSQILASTADQGPSTSAQEPCFRTLRVSLEKISKAKWRFRIRFVFLNLTQDTLTLDDIHTAIYAKYVPTPPYATISYRGEMSLLQDNSVLKGEEDYSLLPGKGYEIVLVLEQSRLEGAPLYGSDSEEPGPMISVCGIFVDYYSFRGAEIERKAIPSDTVYYFQCNGKDDAGELRVVNDEFLREVKSRVYHSESARGILDSLEQIVEQHVSRRPVPRA